MLTIYIKLWQQLFPVSIFPTVGRPVLHSCRLPTGFLSMNASFIPPC